MAAPWHAGTVADQAAAAGPARPGRPGYDQQTVLRRAIALFNRQGYDATSVGDLARDLGLTKSAIYHHVPSKEHLLAAALDEALDGLEAALDAALASEGDAEARLRTVVRESVRVLAEHLPAVTLLLRVHGNSAVELAALRRRRALDDKLSDLVAAAVAAGSLRQDHSPELTSRLLFGLVNSLTEWWSPEGPVDAEAIADAVVSMAFDGLRPRAQG